MDFTLDSYATLICVLRVKQMKMMKSNLLVREAELEARSRELEQRDAEREAAFRTYLAQKESEVCPLTSYYTSTNEIIRLRRSWTDESRNCVKRCCNVNEKCVRRCLNERRISRFAYITSSLQC